MDQIVRSYVGDHMFMGTALVARGWLERYGDAAELRERGEQLSRRGLRRLEPAGGNGFGMAHGPVCNCETGERFARSSCEKRTEGKEELNSTHPVQYICSDFY